MHDELRHHSKQEEFEEAERKAEIGPIVAVLHYVKTITFEVNLPIKVHLVKFFHGNPILARIFYPVTLIMKIQVVLHRSTRVPSLLVLARRYGRGNRPKHHQNRDRGKCREKEGGP